MISSFDVMFPMPENRRNADDMGPPSPIQPPTPQPMTAPADYRAALAELIDAHYADKGMSVSCWTANLTTAIARARALLAAPEARPPAATSPQTLRPVDRYILGEAILAAWKKHGNDSWCSIADEVIAALAAPEAVGVADDEWDALVERLWDQYETVGYQGERFMYCSDFGSAMDLARKELSRYGTAHPAPVPVGERLPGVGDCDAEGRCWWLTLAVTEGGRGGYSTYWTLGTFAEAVRAASHWRPHWALPLPGDQP